MDKNRPRIRPRILEYEMALISRNGVYLDSFIREKFVDGLWSRLASLRESQSATGEELDALLPSVLDRAFKGEL